jgi:hypothetical protein
VLIGVSRRPADGRRQCRDLISSHEDRRPDPAVVVQETVAGKDRAQAC